MMTPVSFGSEPNRNTRIARAQARALRDLRSDWTRWSPVERLAGLALIALPPVASLLFMAVLG